MVIGLIKVLVFNAKRNNANEMAYAAEKKHFEVKTVVNMPYAFAEVIGCQYIDIVKRQIGGKLYSVIFDEDGFNADDPRISLLAPHNPVQNIFGTVVIAGTEDEHGELSDLSDEDVKRIINEMECTRMDMQGKEMIAPIILIR